jgi:hypothetical protein
MICGEGSVLIILKLSQINTFIAYNTNVLLGKLNLNKCKDYKPTFFVIVNIHKNVLTDGIRIFAGGSHL